MLRSRWALGSKVGRGIWDYRVRAPATAVKLSKLQATTRMPSDDLGKPADEAYVPSGASPESRRRIRKLLITFRPWWIYRPSSDICYTDPVGAPCRILKGCFQGSRACCHVFPRTACLTETQLNAGRSALRKHLSEQYEVGSAPVPGTRIDADTLR